MTLAEFSDGFDTLVSSYRRFKDFDNKEIPDSIEFDEYEKSVYLTKSQLEVMIGLYNGTIKGESFEQTEELRRSLSSMVKAAIINDVYPGEGRSLEEDSVFFPLPDNLAYIIYEDVQLSSNGEATSLDQLKKCLDVHNIKTTIRAKVVPIRHDEYQRIKYNPFRGSNEHRVLRLDFFYLKKITSKGATKPDVADLTGANNTAMAKNDFVQGVELVPPIGYTPYNYRVRYLRRPTPIILEDLPNNLAIEGYSSAMNCNLNPLLHQMILERAVVMALRAKLNTIK